MVPTVLVFTHGPEQGLLPASSLYKKRLSIIWFARQKSWCLMNFVT